MSELYSETNIYANHICLFLNKQTYANHMQIMLMSINEVDGEKLNTSLF